MKKRDFDEVVARGREADRRMNEWGDRMLRELVLAKQPKMPRVSIEQIAQDLGLLSGTLMLPLMGVFAGLGLLSSSILRGPRDR